MLSHEFLSSTIDFLSILSNKETIAYLNQWNSYLITPVPFTHSITKTRILKNESEKSDSLSHGEKK